MDVALSDDFLRKKRPNTPVFTYDEFSKIKDLNNPGFDDAIFLYRNGPNFGHWNCLIVTVLDSTNSMSSSSNRKRKRIEIFDPYGIEVDDQLEWLSSSDPIRRQLGQLYPTLTKALLNFDGEVHYNHYKFQQHGDGINTCGRHCLIRLACSNLDTDEYFNMFKLLRNILDMNNDEIAVLLTQ